MADDAVAFPTLTDADMAVMDKLGTRRPMAAGEYLYREGDPTYDFMVVVSGAVDMVVSGNGEEEIVAQPGRPFPRRAQHALRPARLHRPAWGSPAR